MIKGKHPKRFFELTNEEKEEIRQMELKVNDRARTARLMHCTKHAVNLACVGAYRK